MNKIIMGTILTGLIGCVNFSSMKRDSDLVRPLQTNTNYATSSLDYQDKCSVKITKPLAWPIEINGTRFLADYNVGQARTGLAVDFTLAPDEDEPRYSRKYMLIKISEAQKDNLANEGHL